MAQYPEVQGALGEVRKERIPCILPQVVFINCKIFVASVFKRADPYAAPDLEAPVTSGAEPGGDLISR
jgi:hypothetical protein